MLNPANEKLEELQARLDAVTVERAAIKSVDERWNEAAADVVAEEKRWDAERSEILVLANKVGPALTAMKEKLLGDTETYLDARDEYAQLDDQYGAILRRARAVGCESDIPLIPAISADAARDGEQGWRIRKIVNRLMQVRAW